MALDIDRIQAICFDVDGTLSDTDDQWVAAFEHLISPVRWLFPAGQVRPFARRAIMLAETPGNALYHLFDRLGLDDNIGQLYNMIARIGVGRQPKKFWLIEGVRETVYCLHQYYPLAVVSARGRAGTLSFLRQFDLESFFPVVATALTCEFTKPYPDPILWAANQLGVRPDSCLMVGDTTVDIRAGRAAGAQTVGVLCGFGQEKELEKAGADLILPHTAALADVLLKHQ